MVDPRRCIVVANHLPVRVTREVDGSLAFEKDEDALIAHVQVSLVAALGLQIAGTFVTALS